MQNATRISLAFVLLVAASSAPAGELRRGSAKAEGRFDCARPTAEPPAMRGITAAHNRVRRVALGGSSRPLPGLEWSCDLANVAQAYAEKLAEHGCRLAHSDNPFGENLYGSYGFEPTAEHVVDNWASERACTQGASAILRATSFAVRK